MTTQARRLSIEENKETASRWVWGHDGTERATTWQAFLICIACMVPNTVVLSTLSDIGYGLQVYNAVAPTRMSLGGDACACLAAASMCLLYVSDWFYYKSKVVQASTGFVPFCLIMMSAYLKGRKYPFAPLIATLFIIPCALGVIRATVCSKTMRRHFYASVGLVTGACALIMCVTWLVWIFTDGHEWNRSTKDDLVGKSSELYKWVYTEKELNYVQDCHPRLADLRNYTLVEKPKIKAACAKAASVWFLAWASPMVAAICNFVLCIFSFVHGVVHDSSGQPDLIRALKQFMICLVFFFACMYCSISFTSLAMGTTVMAFMGTGVAILVVWTYMEVGSDALLHLAEESKFAKTLAMMWRSDWCRAIAVGATGVFIPIYFGLNRILQKVRVMRKTNQGHVGKYMQQAEWLLQEISTWRWVSILTKVALLAELYFTLNVGVTKITYLALSELKNVLADWNFGLVTVLVFIIGYCMFLLPPVPGVPVYVFTGIVLALLGQKSLGDGDSGFIMGTAIAVVVGFFNKLCACCGQYMIGYFLGKSVKIQQLIHVDSVPTRAIEKILKRPGLDIGKVAVLIGGPDWPVSVTCGILRVSVPQMLLGTTPVFFILTPCVLAGAFISKSGGGEDSIFPLLGNLSLVGMMVGQVSAALVAFLSVMDVIQKDREELEKSREEHKAVEELTKAEEHSNEVYAQVTAWSALSVLDKVILLGCYAAHLFAGFLFLMMGSACFQPFSVDKNIGDSPDVGGLNGKPWKIVLGPGYFALGLFGAAVFLHILHLQMMKFRHKRVLKQEKNKESGGQSFEAQV